MIGKELVQTANADQEIVWAVDPSPSFQARLPTQREVARECLTAQGQTFGHASSPGHYGVGPEATGMGSLRQSLMDDGSIEGRADSSRSRLPVLVSSLRANGCSDKVFGSSGEETGWR